MTVFIGTPGSTANITGTSGGDFIVVEESTGNGVDTLSGGDGHDTIFGDVPAFLYDNVNTNVSIGTALWLDTPTSFFFTSPNPTNDLSTFPNAMILGEGTDTVDFFSVTVAAGAELIADLDFGGNGTISLLDGVMTLVDGAGTVLAQNDDVDLPSPGDIGSDYDNANDNTADPFLSWTNTTGAAQTVYLSVEDAVQGIVPAGQTYLINLSVEAFPNTDTNTHVPDADSISGGDGDDFIVGSGGNDTLDGGLGFDTIFGGAGDDSITGASLASGGAGSNFIEGTSIDYSDFTAGLSASLSSSGTTPTATITHATGVDTLSDYTQVRLTDFADDVLGFMGPNTIYNLGDGDDVIETFGQVGFLGTIEAGDGDDTIIMAGTFSSFAALPFMVAGDGFDTIDFSKGFGAVIVTFDNNLLFQTQSAVNSLFFEVERMIGSQGFDTFTSSGDVSLVLEGSSGNDEFDLTGSTVGHLIYGELASGPAPLGQFDDTVTGGDGNDTVFGNEGDDELAGAGGEDAIDGGSGDDSIQGDADNDTLTGGEGADTLDGGTGTDWLSYTGSTAGVNANLQTGAGLGGDAAGDVLSNFENLEGSAQNDTLTGTSSANVVHGEDGNDTLRGLGGEDTLDGGASADDLSGGSGNDHLIGGLQDDTLRGQGEADVISGDGGSDVIFAGAGADSVMGGLGADDIIGQGQNDTLNGDAGNDTINGGSGNDLINGGDNDDELRGNGNNDTINGDAGNDTIQGGAGIDDLRGGAGDDSISGGTGADRLDGGTGNDTLSGGGPDGVRDFYVFGVGYEQDRINAFDQAGTDLLQLDTDLWSASNPGLTEQQVIDMFGTLNGPGNILTLNFGNGDVLEVQNAGGIDQGTLGTDVMFI